MGHFPNIGMVVVPNLAHPDCAEIGGVMEKAKGSKLTIGKGVKAYY